ncbi:MAG: hypothetical protein COC00_013530 [Rhizobiales bacterium]|nr:hypothetical protein [Hyphomicrobiales bacterium]
MSLAPIVANDDAPPAIDSPSGNTTLLNILDNDLLNGVAVLIGDINLTITQTAGSGSLVPMLDVLTGVITVPAGTPPGTYKIVYQICQSLNSANCNSAIITVTVSPLTHAFDCGDIIGRVFDDKNGNGYYNKGERGLAGVRVVSVKGLLITTDKHGRFNIPCASIPDRKIGSNFILKLDPRTLPIGYSLTTENPRVVRLTRGKLTKLNFGATKGRVIELDLKGEAFIGGSSRPTPRLLASLEQLISKLGDAPYTLNINYVERGEGRHLAEMRVREIRNLLRHIWSYAHYKHTLNIDIRIVKGGLYK